MSEQVTNFTGDTTLRELWDGGTTVNTGVSRKLSPAGRNFSLVAFQQGKPPLDSEINLMQQIQNELRANIVRTMIKSGILQMSVTTGVIDKKNCIRLTNTQVNVNGWLVKVFGANRNDTVSDIVLAEAPYSGSRYDLVFLECWFEEVEPADSPESISQSVYKYGGVNSGTIPNDIKDDIAGDETTRRVQLRWRIRTASDVDFVAYPAGVTHTDRVKARDGASDATDFTFAVSMTDDNLYVAGNGTEAAGKTLSCVDGYVYALPLFKIKRRNQTAYNKDDNPLGSPGYGQSNVTPNGLYHDVIDAGDVTNLFKIAEIYDDQKNDTINAGIASALNGLRQANLELDKWRNQRLQQGTVTIYNKFVISGAVINAISGTRNIQITKTGTYSAANFSQVYIDGKVIGITDSNASVASVPINNGTTAVNYYAYLDYDNTTGAYKVYTALAVPDGKLGLYRIAVPAGDVAANLNACTFTSIRRVESDYNQLYTSPPYAIVTLPGYAAVNTPDYDVALKVESASDSGKTSPTIYDKASNGFKIRNDGTSDNAVIRWTLLNPNVN